MRSKLITGPIMAPTLALSAAATGFAQRIDALSPQVRKYVRVSTGKVVLEHVSIIDGTGAAAIADRNISISDGKITAISPGADQPASDGTTILNLRGYSVMPGIVGMHEHLFQFVRPNPAVDGTFDAPAMFNPNDYNIVSLTGSRPGLQLPIEW